MTLPTRQLLVFRFGADATFEGQLVGALERLESGGALRVLEVLFVAAPEATGDAERGEAGAAFPDRALGGDEAEVLRDLGTALEPGTALAAVLVEHLWAGTLDDAVSRVGGRPLTSEFVEAGALSELPPDLPRNLL